MGRKWPIDMTYVHRVDPPGPESNAAFELSSWILLHACSELELPLNIRLPNDPSVTLSAGKISL